MSERASGSPGHDHMGLVSVAMAFTRGPISFYVLRFLLGLAGAASSPELSSISATGSPQIIARLSRYVYGRRARSRTHRLADLRCLDAAQRPARPARLAVALPPRRHPSVGARLHDLSLPYRPSRRRAWLTTDERDGSHLQFSRSKATLKIRAATAHGVPWPTGRSWQLSLAYFGTSAASIHRLLGPADRQGPGLLSLQRGPPGCHPNLIAVIGMILWSRNSDRTGERYGTPPLRVSLARSGWP